MQNQCGPTEAAETRWSRIEGRAERWDGVLLVVDRDGHLDDSPEDVVRVSIEEAARQVRVAAGAKPRSEFELHRDIAAVLGSSGPPDCSNCRAIDMLKTQAKGPGFQAASIAILSPCGWIFATEDADSCGISTVKLNLRSLLGKNCQLGSAEV